MTSTTEQNLQSPTWHTARDLPQKPIILDLVQRLSQMNSVFESIFSPCWSCHHFALDRHTNTRIFVTKVYCRNVSTSCNEHPGHKTSSVLPNCCQWSDHLLFQSNMQSSYCQRCLETTKESNSKVISWQIRSQHYWATIVIVNCKQL